MPVAALWARWGSLPRSTQLLIAGIAAAAILATALAALLLRDDRVALYGRPLLSEQVAEVDQRLTTWNVAHATSAENVLVPAADRSRLLLKLSLAGVPRAHLVDTSEALQRVGTLTPQEVLEAQTRAGLEGDLELALRGIDGVSDARVIVAPAKPAFFADETPRAASASVALHVQPGVSLAAATVGGIRAFVANGVPGLDPAHVTVIDDRGATLDGNGPAGEGSPLEKKIQTALDAAFGAGTSVVLVNAQADQSTRTEREVKRAPVLGKALSTHDESEHYTGANKRYVKSRTDQDRGSDAVEIDRTTPPGAIARLSVAVFVDAALHDQIRQIRDLVTAAAGLDPKRGDTVAIEPVAFAHHAGPALLGRHVAGRNPYLPYAAGGLGLAGLALLVWPAAGKRGRTTGADERAAPTALDDEAISTLESDALRAQLALEPPWTAAAVLSRLPAAQAVAVLEGFPAESRREIVSRMGRPVPLIAQDVDVRASR